MPADARKPDAATSTEPSDLCTCGHERHVHASIDGCCTDPGCVLYKGRPYRCGRFVAASDAARVRGGAS